MARKIQKSKPIESGKNSAMFDTKIKFFSKGKIIFFSATSSYCKKKRIRTAKYLKENKNITFDSKVTQPENSAAKVLQGKFRKLSHPKPPKECKRLILN